LKAKGLLCHLLALPETWDLYVEEVEKWHKDGKKAIYSAFKELSELGYMERLQKRERGLFKGYEYIVHEVPFTQKRETDKRDAEKAPLLNTDIKLNTDINKKRNIPFVLQTNRRKSSNRKADATFSRLPRSPRANHSTIN